MNTSRIALSLSKIIFTLLFLAISLIPFNSMGWKIRGIPLEYLVPSLIIIPFTLLLVGRYFLSREKLFLLDEYEKWLITLIFILIVLNFFSINTKNSSKVLAGFILKGILVSYLSYNLAPQYSKNNALKTITIIGATVAFFSIPGLLSYWGAPKILPLHKIVGFYPMLNPLPIAAYLTLSSAIAIYLSLNAKTTFSKLATLLQTLLIFVCILLSFSRSGYLSTLIALGIYFLFLKKVPSQDTSQKKSFRKLILFLIISGTIIILSIFLLKFQNSSSPLRKFNPATIFSSHSLTHRLNSYGTIIYISSLKPLTGIGLGNYTLLHEQYAVDGVELNTPTPDNMYLRLLSETGLLGTLTFLTFVIYWLKKLWHYAIYSCDLSVAASLGGLIGFCFNMLFADLLFWPATQFAFWTLFGLAARNIQTKAS